MAGSPQITLSQIIGTDSGDGTVLFANVANANSGGNVNSSSNLIWSIANNALQIGGGTINNSSLTYGSGRAALVLQAGGTQNDSILVMQSAGGSIAGMFYSNATLVQIYSGGIRAMNVQSTGAVQVANSPLVNTQTQVATGLAVFLKANTTRTNQSALTNEANMTLTFNETGVYKFDAAFNFSGTGTGTCGLIMDFGGGNFGIANTNLITPYKFNGVGGTSQVTGIGSPPSNGAFSFAVSTLSTGGADYVKMDGIMNVIAPGTLILRYAQNFANSGQTVTLIANSSYMMATKIG